jgi:hypothetical protein
MSSNSKNLTIDGDDNRMGRLRRRSTINWTGASPGTRQKKLEDVTESKMADTWFSLHCDNVDGELILPLWLSGANVQALYTSVRLYQKRW